DIAAIETKIKEGNDIAELNSFAFDAVTYAILEKVPNETITYLLTKKGNGVNKLTHDGRTYIFWAAYKDNLELMKYLLSKGAKTDIIDSHGYSLLNFAAVTGQQNLKLYDFCVANGADVIREKNRDGANALLLVAPYVKDVKLIDYFTKKGVALHSTDNNGNGIFNYTARTGNIAMMNKLIQKKVAYKTRNKEGGNAMIFASQGTRRATNPLSVFQYLEKKGIDPNVVTAKGITPLHALAYRSKDIDVFEYFIRKGVDINQADEKGNTAFLNAARSNDLNIVTFLSRKVKNINTANKEGQSALTMAVLRNTPEVVDFLLKKGADVRITDKKGNNLAYYLITSYNPGDQKAFEHKLKALTAKKFAVTTPQKDGNTLFHLAIAENDLTLLKKIHALGVDVNAKNNEGVTVLHKAAMKAKNDAILKYLISIGADKNVKTAFDESVYDLASENEVLKKNRININFLK
ncbi:MAG: ankyrin repeat domain-containing protein, partial [Bacteroidota bacterium]